MTIAGDDFTTVDRSSWEKKTAYECEERFGSRKNEAKPIHRMKRERRIIIHERPQQLRIPHWIARYGEKKSYGFCKWCRHGRCARACWTHAARALHACCLCQETAVSDPIYARRRSAVENHDPTVADAPRSETAAARQAAPRDASRTRAFSRNHAHPYLV